MGRASPLAAYEVPASADAAVRRWLLAVAALVLVMVTIGGATRLTGSGLSITEWHLVMGAIPPLSEGAWRDAFAKYQGIPQYTQINKGMGLEAFKFIFWWEWGHRFLGRLIGLAYAAPLAWFWWRGQIRADLKLPLLGLLLFGGLQGGIGWFMVQSGLSDRVDVSQYRLALHLGMAFALLGGLVWIASSLDQPTAAIRLRTVTSWQRRVAMAVVGLILLQVIAGAFVAGLKAGLTYNTWPLMDGRLIPAGLGTLSPWYLNLFENITTVQFNHRVLAYVVTAAVLWHTLDLVRSADDERVRRSSTALLAVVIGQVLLGIGTLVWVVPLPLALAHQGLAAILFALAVRHLFLVRAAAGVTSVVRRRPASV
jgi:heme a synthase